MQLPLSLPVSPHRTGGATAYPNHPTGRANSPAQDPAPRVTDAQRSFPRLSSGKILPPAGGTAAECPWDGGAGRRPSQGWALAGSRVRGKAMQLGRFCARWLCALALFTCAGHTWNQVHCARGRQRLEGLALESVGRGGRSSHRRRSLEL